VALTLAFAVITLFPLPALATQGPDDPMWIFLGIVVAALMAGLAAIIYFLLRRRARKRGLPEGRYWLTWVGCMVGASIAPFLSRLSHGLRANEPVATDDVIAHTTASASASAAPASSFPLPEPAALPVWIWAILAVSMVLIMEVWLWGWFYLMIGTVPDWETALYFSASSFTTVGFGDVYLDKDWRLLSSIEAMNGFLMFGWSTAFIFEIVSHVYRKEGKAINDK